MYQHLKAFKCNKKVQFDTTKLSFKFEMIYSSIWDETIDIKKVFDIYGCNGKFTLASSTWMLNKFGLMEYKLNNEEETFEAYSHPKNLSFSLSYDACTELDSSLRMEIVSLYG